MNGLFKTSTGDLRWGWKALIEFGVILAGLVFVLLLTNPGRKSLSYKGERNVSAGQ